MDQPIYMRLICVIQGIEIHLKTGGKMSLTRIATPANLRAIATEYTGKSYPRSKKGLEAALADLKKVKEEVNSKTARDIATATK